MNIKILLDEAIDAMQPAAAQQVLDLAQMLAENYPRKIGMKLVGKRKEIDIDVFRMFAETSPSGISIVSGADFKVIWSNNVYQEYFVNLESREINNGVSLKEIIPQFAESGLAEIFKSVAETGKMFCSQQFPLMMSCGMTYWNWTLTRFPAAGDQEMKLLIQMHKVDAPAQQTAA